MQEFLNLITTWLGTFNIHINLSEKLFLFGFDTRAKAEKYSTIHSVICQMLYLLFTM